MVYQSAPCERLDYLSEHVKAIIARENSNRRCQAFLEKVSYLNKKGFSEDVVEKIILEAKEILYRTDLGENIKNEFKKGKQQVLEWQEKVE